MKQSNLIAIDLAKTIFQVCGMSKHHTVLFNQQLKRSQLAGFMVKQPACTVAMEACYSSHYWARCFEAMGHTVKLLPAQHVKPFVRGNKSDHNDALAIAEAAQRPNLRAIPIKTIEQQDIQSLHRIRERVVHQRTHLTNQTRGLLADYGIVIPKGQRAFCQLLNHALSDLSPLMQQALHAIADEYYTLCDRLETLNVQLSNIAKQNPYCQLLMTLPGIGFINATALYSAIGRGQQFTHARDFAVWLGLTPKHTSSGSTLKTSGITKRGNRYLRKQLVHGARAAVSRCQNKEDHLSRWANALLARRGRQKAYVAYAAKIARIAWVMLQRNEPYHAMA